MPKKAAVVVKSEDVLLSEGKPATSDVRGNLGAAQTVTSSKMDDWLKDRWQAASDMSGTPIEGRWLRFFADAGTHR
eukprot:776565-Rhodomonas_salina.1